MSLKIHIPSYHPIINNPVSLVFDNESPFLVIQGTNGCGKSTLFHILIGLKNTQSKPYILVNDEKQFFPIDQKELIRYLPQIPENALFSDLSVKDNVKLLKEIYRIDESVIKICDDIAIENYNLSLWHLSVGQKKMLLLELLIKSLPLPSEFGKAPLILLFDEPFAGLDNHNQQKVFNIITKLATDYSNSPFKIIIIDHLNITPVNDDKKQIIQLRKGISLNVIPTTKITYNNGK